MKRKSVLFVLLMLLSGCSVAREDMRFTYDYKKVSPGHTRDEIENEIGSSDRDDYQPDGSVRSIYTTSRVDPGTKRGMVNSQIGLDIFTVGLAEFMSPFGILDQDPSKIFTIYYGADQMAIQVYATCKYYYPKQVHQIPENPKFGVPCVAFLQG